MKPLLAHIYEPHRITYPCYVQPKLNGVRALYQNGHFQSRDEIPFPEGLLDHLSVHLASTFSPEVILDGELYVHGWPLQRINAAVTPVRQAPTEDTVLVEYHVFDRVDFNKMFSRRIEMSLDKYKFEQIKRVKTALVQNEGEANRRYSHYVSNGYEGVMYRLGDCPYTQPKQKVWNKLEWDGSIIVYNPPRPLRAWSDQDNRTFHLLKRKSWQDDEFLCIGVEEGEGKYAGTLGAFRCSTPSGKEFTVGSGIVDTEREYYWGTPPIGRKIKVKYLCLSADGIPLNPTILAIL